MKRYSEEGVVEDHHVDWQLLGYAAGTAVEVNGELGRLRLGQNDGSIVAVQLWQYIEELKARGAKFRVVNNEVFVDRFVKRCLRDLSQYSETITFHRPQGALTLVQRALEHRRNAGGLNGTELKALEKALSGAEKYFGA